MLKSQLKKKYNFSLPKTLAFLKELTLEEKDSDSCFDETMGSYEGAELWKFISICLFSQVCTMISKNDGGR